MENRTFACENAEQLIKLILSRRSYRGTFSPDPVPREDLEKIMEAGLAAPSGCNKQTTSLIAADDPRSWSRSVQPLTRLSRRPRRR